MSVTLLGYAFFSPLGPGPKSLLLALCWHVNDAKWEEGICDPGRLRLSSMTSMTERSVSTNMAILVKDGYVARVRRNRRAGQSEKYKIDSLRVQIEGAAAESKLKAEQAERRRLWQYDDFDSFGRPRIDEEMETYIDSFPAFKGPLGEVTSLEEPSPEAASPNVTPGATSTTPPAGLGEVHDDIGEVGDSIRGSALIDQGKLATSLGEAASLVSGSDPESEPEFDQEEEQEGAAAPPPFGSDPDSDRILMADFVPDYKALTVEEVIEEAEAALACYAGKPGKEAVQHVRWKLSQAQARKLAGSSLASKEASE